MLIWIFAVLLLASVGVVAFNFGAVRAAFAFVGLLLGALLAMPLGHLLTPLVAMWVKDPLWQWALGPLLAFALVLTACKLTGRAVFQKVDVYYKYKAGDLRMAMFERVNHRLGLAIGLANGMLYLILASVPIYSLSYATSQLYADESAGLFTKMLNGLGKGMETSGLSKIAAALDPVPADYYDVVDTIALLHRNPLAESRLTRYPGFLTLGQTGEFQEIGKDLEFSQLRLKQPPFSQILEYHRVQGIWNNPDLLRTIWKTVAPDLHDFQAFLRTGHSTKYDAETILGRWTFDLNGTLGMIRRANPDLSSKDMDKRKFAVTSTLQTATFMASPDKALVMKNLGTVKPGPARPATPAAKGVPAQPAQPTFTIEHSDIQGKWSSAGGGKYVLELGSRGALDAVVEGDFLSVTGDTFPWRFSRDY